MSFAAPAFLWALLGIPLVVLLHFLRTQRTRRDVAAVFLWREARELAEARRRMSPTWLLLVQILFVAAAALALAQPQLSFIGPPDAVLVLDASASMAAREADGRTRLELAVEGARAVAGGSGRVAVVRAGLEPTVVHALGAGQAAGVALEGLAAGDRASELERAVDLAGDIAAGGEVHVFTDAAVAPRAGLVVHPVGGAVENVGIVAFDVGLQEAFVAVAGNAARPQEVALVLLREGEEVASTSLFVPVGGQGTVTFPLDESGIYEARITPPAGDALALDDVAFAGRSNLVVVMDRPVEPVQRALAALPAVSVRVTGAAANVPADVRVLTGADPADLEQGSYLLLTAPSAQPTYRVVRDVDQAHPLMRFVDIRDTVVGVAPERLPEADAGGPEGPSSGADATAADAAGGADDASAGVSDAPAGAPAEVAPGPAADAAGGAGAVAPEPGAPDATEERDEAWTVLARDAALTPLIRWRDEPDLQILDLAFHPSQSDVVLRPAFPALIANAVRTFRGDDRLPLGAVVPNPDEDSRRILEPGVYEVAGRERTASLLAAAETRLAAAPPAPQSPPAATEGGVAERARSLAPWLLLAALVALAAEWLLSRRTRWWAVRGR